MQNDSTCTIDKKRLITIGTAQAIGYTGTMIALGNIWYKDYDQSPFHFFDDHKEWLQMDKLGHGFTGYYFSQITSSSFKWTGMNNKSATILGSGLGLLYLSSIEVFDGFSDKWGASASDLLANSIGVSLYVSQELIWQEQKIIPKFSFHKSNYAQYRPSALGSNYPEMLIKDYNGQTYWLSANIQSLTNIKAPKWLNLAIGYGADGMIGGTENPLKVDGHSIPQFKRQRQFYLSFDIDLSRIQTKSKFIKAVCHTFNFIKVPFPTLEFTSGTAKFHALYF